MKKKTKEYNAEYHLRKESVLRARRKAKLQAIRAYSPQLICQWPRCNFSDLRALSIDHIKGGGKKHIKEIGWNFYFWLRKNNYPSGFQVLCMNHQKIKQYVNKEFSFKDNNKTPIYIIDRVKRRYYNNRQKVLQHYLPSLTCKCGENDIRALSLDHINGKGCEDRRRFYNLSGFYTNIIKRGFPPKFQVLCMNCNIIKKMENKEFGKKI